jgi:hypothetical protein
VLECTLTVASGDLSLSLLPAPAATQAGADASAADATGARAAEAAAEAGPEAREVVETLLPLTQPPPGAGKSSLAQATVQHLDCTPAHAHLQSVASLAGSALICMQGGLASGAPSR